MEKKIAVEMTGISKSFGRVRAVDDVDLKLYSGEILALLGENGSGKTSLMNMLAGIYYPDSGTIKVKGQEVDIKRPSDSQKLGIGMIHQHFKLIETFTVAENVILGLEGSTFTNKKQIREEIDSISKKYGFDLRADNWVYDLSVSEKQSLEILKVLYRGADILILDEPTAVLTPQESDRLFNILRMMRNEGKAIIIITHKLNEVLDISDRVYIMRNARAVDLLKTDDADEAILVEKMVGHRVKLEIDRPETEKRKVLQVKNLNYKNEEGIKKLKGLSFDLYAGEVLGVCGVSGSGQKELCDSIYGLNKGAEGSITFIDENKNEREILGKGVKEIKSMGIRIAYVPEDRLGMGLIGSAGITDNMLLKNLDKEEGFFLSRENSEKNSEKIVKLLDISTPDLYTPVRNLSGGNIQKVLLGREIASYPKIFIVSYPTRGLDTNSSYLVYKLINDQKEKGVAILYVGEDLDVILEISDRLMVLSDGEMTGIREAENTSREEIGRLMASSK